MILLAGIPSEPPLRLAIEAAEKLNIPYVIFNQRFAHTYNLSLKYSKGKFSGNLQIDGKNYLAEEFNGIYIRLMDYNFLPELKNKVFNYIGADNVNRTIQIHKYLLKWIEVTGSRVVNLPINTMSNMSKPYQAQLIAATSLLIPPTLITNSIDIVNFFKKKNKELIFKSISSVRSIVKELNDTSSKNLNLLKFLPTQFQKQLRGTNIRVHVIGKKTFGTEIKSEITDYRYSSREGITAELYPVTLPVKIKNECIKISEIFRLPFCGIDLFKTTDSEYYCFEVNPSPGYSYYQESTGQDIAGALVNYLEFGK